MIVVSHPTANNFVRELTRKLIEENMLTSFFTSIAIFSQEKIDLFPKHIAQDLKRRSFDDSFKTYTHTYPWREVGRIVATKAHLEVLTKHEKGAFSVDAVYNSIDNRVASQLHKFLQKNAKIVYAYEDGAFASFKQAKELGLKCAYDLPIAHWHNRTQLLKYEAERLPEWSRTLGGGIADSSSKLKKKDTELKLADLVVVPSKFVADSLPKWVDSSKVVISPFGTPFTTNLNLTNHDAKRPDKNRPLRVLFAGSMGQRKGLADLFEAIKILNRPDIELVVMGSLQAPLKFYYEELPNFIYEAGRPNDAVLELMRTCDVFCLPSIVEGRALVMQEAMSQGLPLIITTNTGGEDLISEGKTGYLVPIRAPYKIAEKLDWFADHRQETFEMGILAQQHAKLYTWDRYATTIIAALRLLMIL
ncbi:glycosyltransferase family 4 protein [Runella zeae]|uniref:glycosyltransferase family 4 protein n=1 Tax=Runella zeae TaxID=94255 RepID=UPI0003FAFD8F|nr:glycosyltransferase family 4 protein [Runella zeae]